MKSLIIVDITEWILWLFTPSIPGGNKGALVFKQICSFYWQVSLRFYNLLSPLGIKEVKRKCL